MRHLKWKLKLSCLQVSQPFDAESHLVTWSWVSPWVLWTKRHPSCFPSFSSWSLCASFDLGSFSWFCWAFLSLKLALDSLTPCFSSMMLWEAWKMFSSPMGCFEETISPSTSCRRGFVCDISLLISSDQTWKFSRSSMPLLIRGRMPLGFCMLFMPEVWQLLFHAKLTESKQVKTRRRWSQNSATMLRERESAASSFWDLEPKQRPSTSCSFYFTLSITGISGFGFWGPTMAASWRITVFQKFVLWNPYFYSVLGVCAFWARLSKKGPAHLALNLPYLFFVGFCFFVGFPERRRDTGTLPICNFYTKQKLPIRNPGGINYREITVKVQIVL